MKHIWIYKCIVNTEMQFTPFGAILILELCCFLLQLWFLLLKILLSRLCGSSKGSHLVWSVASTSPYLLVFYKLIL